MQRSRTTRTIRALAAVAVAAVVTTAMAACGSSSSSKSSAASETLRVVATSAITSLNPVLNGTGLPNELFLDPAYEPLIIRSGDGEFKPGLATKWSYNDDNTEFTLTLRNGVKFSDGEKLTAQGVKEWIEYFQTAPGSVFATQFAGIKSVDVQGDDTLVLHLAASDPLWPVRLTQNRYGYVISPKAIKDPDALGTMTAGAGQYVIDKNATVSGSTYTYVPNKYYYDKSAVHYAKIVVTVVTDPNATLSALQSGQQDFAVGQARSADAAESAGLNVKAVPFLWNSIMLLDRNGEQVPALKDVRVRQALNYAVDRKTVAKAVFGKYATPNVSMVLPGFDSYSEAAEGTYDYDPAKAKALLKEAGYENGFTMTGLVFNRNGTDETVFSQALQGELKKIGVTLKLVDSGDGSTVIPDLIAKKYPVFPFFGQSEEANQLVQEQLLPDSGVLNPFKVDDPKLLDLYNTVQSSPTDKLPDALQALQKYIVEQAIYLQVSISDNLYFSSKKVTGLSVSAAQPIPYILDLKPAS